MSKKYYRYPSDYEMTPEEAEHDSKVRESVKALITLMSEGQSYVPSDDCIDVIRTIVGLYLEDEFDVPLDEIILSIYPEGELTKDGAR